MPYLNSKEFQGFAPAVYNTLDDMRNDPEVLGANDGPCLAVLTGGSAAFDVTPSGLYGWSASSSAADNGTTVIKNNNVVTTGRWIRLAS